jgi:hypothetical protein
MNKGGRNYGALNIRGTHDVVLRNELILIDDTKNIASTDNIAFLEVQGLVLPFTLSVCETDDAKCTCSEQEHRLHGE